MPTNWIDDPITTTTPIKAVHINEIRSAINSLRDDFGLEQIDWIDDPIVAQGTHIRAVHIAEIANAVQDLWFRLGLGSLPPWSTGSPPLQGTPIRANHINDLRSWINDIEEAPSLPDPQGVVSKLYNAESDTIVDSTWVDDVTSLKPTGTPLLVRVVIESAESTNAISSYHIARFGSGVQLYQDRGHPVVGVLTGNFDRYDKINPSDPNRKIDYCPNYALDLNNDPLLNKYIQHYANRAASFAANMQTYGLTTFWIWNEPQLQWNPDDPESGDTGLCTENGRDPGTMAPENFGALLYKTTRAIRDQIPSATIYAGSLVVQHPDYGQINKATTYLTRMYQYLNQNGVYASSSPYGYGWNALGVNLHGFPDEDYTGTLWSALRAVAVSAQHLPFSVIVGEWGAKNSDLENEGIGSAIVRDSFLAIRKYFPTMYYYIHPYDYTNDFGARRWEERAGVFNLLTEEGWYRELDDYLYEIED